MDKASRLALAIAHEAGHVAAAMAVDWRVIRAEAHDDGTGCTVVEPPACLRQIPGFNAVWAVADADERGVQAALATLESDIQELRLAARVVPPLRVAAKKVVGFLIAGALAEGNAAYSHQPMHGDGNKALRISNAFGMTVASLNGIKARMMQILAGSDGTQIRAAFRIQPDGTRAVWTLR